MDGADREVVGSGEDEPGWVLGGGPACVARVRRLFREGEEVVLFLVGVSKGE